MSTPQPHVSFLIVNWNGGPMLRACLDSIAAQTFRDYEVIVVDNGSTDGSADLPHFGQPGWSLHRRAENAGFSAANNQAFAAARGEWIALVNNDVLLEADWLARMLERGEAAPQAGSVACRLLQLDDPTRLDSAGFAFFSCATVRAWYGAPEATFDHLHHAPLGAVAAAALYRRSALERTGLFHPEYFAYYEDTDLALRLHAFGYGCVYAAEARARHRGSATGGRGSAFTQYQLRRNVEYLYWVDMVGGLAWRYLIPHLLYELCSLLAALPRGRLGNVLRAKREAWRNRGWIRSERARLRANLQAAGAWPSAQRRLRAAMTPWWQVILRPAR